MAEDKKWFSALLRIFIMYLFCVQIKRKKPFDLSLSLRCLFDLCPSKILILSCVVLHFSLQASITSYKSLLHQSPHGMLFSNSRFVFDFSSFSFRPSAAPAVAPACSSSVPWYNFHLPCHGLLFMVDLSHVRGSIYFGSLLALISFVAIALFPICLVPLSLCLQHILTRYCLVFRCSVKWKIPSVFSKVHCNSTTPMPWTVPWKFNVC